VSSWLAVPFVLFAAPHESTGLLALNTACVSAIWFILSYFHRRAGLFTASQLMLSLSAVFATTAWVKQTAWYAALAHPLLEPWFLQIQGIVLGVVSLAWVIVRIWFKRRVDRGSVATAEGAIETFRWLLYPPWPPLDWLTTGVLLFGLAAMAGYGVMPGILSELGLQTRLGIGWQVAGVSHSHSSDVGAWVLWALLLVLLVVRLWEQFDRWLIHGALLTLAIACPLIAAHWGVDGSMASALRWASAGLLLVFSVPIWMRSHLHRWVLRLDWPNMEPGLTGLARESRNLLVVVTMTPILALTLYPAMATIMGSPPAPVPAGTFFRSIGDPVSYVVPLAIAFVVLAGHAVRERSEVLAFSAGLILNLTVTLGYTLHVVLAGTRPNDANILTRLIQLNALTTATFALLWLTSRGWLVRVFTGLVPEKSGMLLRVQAAIAVVFLSTLVVPADIRLLLFPMSISRSVVEVGSVLGWVALVATVAAYLWLCKARGVAPGERTVGACVLITGTMAACSICNWDSGYFGAMVPAVSKPWLGYHALMVARVLGAWSFVAWIWYGHVAVDLERAGAMESEWYARRAGKNMATRRASWAVVLGVFAVILALRNALDSRDLSRPWWPMGALVCTAALMATLGCLTLSRRRLYWAGIIGNMAATSWCIAKLWPGHLVDTVNINIIALALPAVLWLVLDLRFIRERGPQSRFGLPAFHHVAAIGSLVAISLVVAMNLVADAAGRTSAQPAVVLGWGAFVSVAIAALACLWDSQARYASGALYFLGLVAVGITLDQLNLQSRWLGWTGLIILAAYSIGTSYMWSRRTEFRGFGELLRLPHREEGRGLWLVMANQLLAAFVVALAYWIVLTLDGKSLGISEARALSMRVLAAKAALGQALAVGLLARGTRRTQLQLVSLWLVAVGAVAWGWAWLNPTAAGDLLNRAVVVLTVLAGMTALYGVGLGKLLRRENEWTLAAQRLMPWLAGLCAGCLVLILATEVGEQIRTGTVEMAGTAILVVALALAGLCVTALILALVPGRDPLQLPERGRMVYVYSAEGLLGLLFMHIRLTKAEWFHGFFEQFWPLIVLGIAYLGIGLSEIFQRQRRWVLAEPLQRTGTLLPVLPVLGYWALPYETHFSWVLVCAGVLYGVVSVTRKSFGFGVLASLAANGGLVYLLKHDLGYGFFEHAQFWLIPGALCVAAAAYLNRDQLSSGQFTAIRYMVAMVIYVSSTADIFLTGVRAAPWLPLVLMMLSVMGIFVGIVLRVRAFLFAGSSFLLLSLVTMILSAHLNLNWTWLWWVAGISLGVVIIVVFALLEKKRTEVLQIVDGLRSWDG
jgi:hypothetical protein